MYGFALQFEYVVYPPEGERPPIGQDFYDLVRRNKEAKEKANQEASK